MERLGRKREVNTLCIEALDDLHIDPGGMLQVIPVLWRMVPVVDEQIERIGIKIAEIDQWREIHLIDLLVRMGLALGTVAGGRCFRYRVWLIPGWEC